MIHLNIASMWYSIATKFKYILCYGSSPPKRTTAALVGIFKYILCYGSSDSSIAGTDVQTTFKYILCYGSSDMNGKLV